MASEEIKAQSEWAIKYNRCCNALGGGDIVTCTEKIYTMIEELRKTKHALWMARALRAKIEAKRFFWFLSVDVSQGNREAEIWHESLYKKWCWVERKCREKAKEFQ